MPRRRVIAGRHPQRRLDWRSVLQLRARDHGASAGKPDARVCSNFRSTRSRSANFPVSHSVAQGKCVPRSVAQRRVVENHPGIAAQALFRARRGNRRHNWNSKFWGCRAAANIQSMPSPWHKRADGRIGRHARDMMACEQVFDLGSEPAWMSRLERGGAVIVLAQPVEEIRWRESKNSAGAGSRTLPSLSPSAPHCQRILRAPRPRRSAAPHA